MKRILSSIFIVAAILLSCKQEFELPQPVGITGTPAKDRIFLKQDTAKESSTIVKDGSYAYTINTATPVSKDFTLALEDTNALKKVVSDYNAFKGVKDYLILPATNYTVVSPAIQRGISSADFNVEIKGYNSLEQGNYILPLKMIVDGRSIIHLVFVRKDVQYVPLSATNKKNLPPSDACSRTEPMKMVAYVETNDYDIRNMGQFLLKKSKKPVFDIVILFAANINYDAKQDRRILFFNDKLQPVLKDPEKYIKPLKDKGIKVLITMLPNHQGVGYENFRSYDEAIDFAKQCKLYTDKLGIDGWDIDEEYADYNKTNIPVIGVKSYFWFMKAMKEIMPDKLLTLYDYGHPLKPDSKDESGKTVSNYVDYSWANYSEGHGSYAGLPNTRYGQLSVEANNSLFFAEFFARSNVSECYGLQMFFNIQGDDIKSGNAATELSKATKLIYGEECEFAGIYNKGPKDN